MKNGKILQRREYMLLKNLIEEEAMGELFDQLQWKNVVPAKRQETAL